MRFCSNECRHKGAPPKGEEHHNWRGGVSDRSRAEAIVTILAVKEVGCCERCGSQEDLQGHHVEHRSRNPGRSTDRANIQVLCADCHAKEHPDIANFILAGKKAGNGTWVSCAGCGESLYRRLSRSGGNRYCSKECYFENKTGNGRPILMATDNCIVCGKRFTRTEHREGKGLCCSRSCAARWGHVMRKLSPR